MTTTINRRRGDDLEDAIYQAAYALLQHENYQAITFSKIAAAAHTSRSVLYRHWDTPFELLFSAMHHHLKSANIQLTDTNFDDGNLRANLIHTGRQFMNFLASMLPEFNHMMLAEMTSQTAMIQKILHEMQQGNLAIIDRVLTLAIATGELQQLPPRPTLLALFQIIRYTFIVEAHTLDTTEIIAIVDKVVLPAVLATGRNLK